MQVANLYYALMYSKENIMSDIGEHTCGTCQFADTYFGDCCHPIGGGCTNLSILNYCNIENGHILHLKTGSKDKVKWNSETGEYEFMGIAKRKLQQLIDDGGKVKRSSHAHVVEFDEKKCVIDLHGRVTWFRKGNHYE